MMPMTRTEKYNILLSLMRSLFHNLDVAEVLRDRWREEALERWSADEFDAKVERLREERENSHGAA
jgi:hypothetical protein